MTQSKYQKAGKTPHRYSSAYYDWKAAAMRGDDKGMNEARERMNRANPLPQHHD